MRALRDAVRLAESFATRHPAETLAWDWDAAIFLYGVEKLRACADDRDPWRAYLARYHAAWAARLPRIDRSDLCAPALTALALARQGCDVGLTSARAVARYVACAPRNSAGAIDHLGRSARRALYPRSIWVDSLMMYAVFAAQWGAWTGDAALLDFAAAQPGRFARCMQDATTGLFCHAWLEGSGRAVPRGAFWLRGNGWVVASIVEILDALPPAHARRAELVSILDRVAGALAARQRPTGAWGTLVDRASYEEASGTALVAYALAKGARSAWLDAELHDVAARAFERVTATLEPTRDGLSLPGISGATNALPAFTYAIVPRRRDLPYGVGAYLMAACELSLG